MKKFILFLIAGILFAVSAEAQTLTAKVNRNPVPVGEVFVLSLEYDGDPGSKRPDFSVLNQNFTVSMVSNSYRGTYSNGNLKKVYIWEVSLMADKTGTIEIPSLSIGNAQSQPISLKVVEASDASVAQAEADAAPRFSVKRSISNPNPFVQQQINYSFKIKTTVPLQGNMPQFMASNSDDWLIRTLGEPIVTKSINNGVEEQEITVNYALFPQKSGKLVIPEAHFNGFYVDNSRRGGNLLDAFGGLSDPAFGLDIFGRKVPVNLKARAISINVKKIPEQNNGSWWLPAKRAELYSDWQQKLPEFKQGEAVGREIYLRVTGVIDSQMPQVQIADVAGMKIYPEKPEIKSEIKGDDVVSVMRIKSVYIPEKTGEVIVPAVRVKWYNVETNKFEQAELPAQKINVLKGKNSVETAEGEKTQDTLTIPQQRTRITASAPKEAEKGTPVPLWLYITVAFIGGAVLSYGVIFFTSKKQKRLVQTPDASELVSVAKAFRGNDLREIRNQVLNWARKMFPSSEIHNLDAVAELLQDDTFSQELKKLSKALYRDEAKDFDINTFSQQFMRVSKTVKRRQKKDDVLLPKLYK